LTTTDGGAHDRRQTLNEGVAVARTFDDFGRETDEMGHIKDPAERYQQFMLWLHDILAVAGDYGYSPEACQMLAQARLAFMYEFEARHPGYGKGRAVWR
jgi:hypothetical protein